MFAIFRWRGENVSTTEVEAIISNILELQDVSSYGVEIPGAEGRASMISIVNDKGSPVDLDQLYRGVKSKLPSYAMPLFVRLTKEADMTGKMMADCSCSL